MAWVHCPLCHSQLPLAVMAARQGDEVACTACGRASHIQVLPALIEAARPKPPPPPPDPPGEGEAACFYSPGRKATQTCGHCGVLISDVWAAQWGRETICLKCLEHLSAQAKDQRFESQRRLWDNITLALACVPLTGFLWFFAFVTAPAALLVGLWHWNSPRSLVPRSRWRLVLGLLLAVAQIGFGLFLILGLWFGRFK